MQVPLRYPLTVFQRNPMGEESTYTFELSPIDDSSLTITLIDADGSSSSETAVFYDSDTMVIGDTTFIRSVG